MDIESIFLDPTAQEWSGTTTILRGFKCSVAVLDRFLDRFSVEPTNGFPPDYRLHPFLDKTSGVLFRKAIEFCPNGVPDRMGLRVVIPCTKNEPQAKTAYVAYAWASVSVQRELDIGRDLVFEEVPLYFRLLRVKLLSARLGLKEEDLLPDEGKLGVYMVVTHYPARFLEVGGRPRKIVKLTAAERERLLSQAAALEDEGCVKEQLKVFFGGDPDQLTGGESFLGSADDGDLPRLDQDTDEEERDIYQELADAIAETDILVRQLTALPEPENNGESRNGNRSNGGGLSGSAVNRGGVSGSGSNVGGTSETNGNDADQWGGLYD